MIVLDTNVITELMRPSPNPRVLSWADELDPGAVAITSMNAAEILHGLARLPDGRRRQALQQSWDTLLSEVFAGRVWGFNGEAAHWYGQLLSRRERLGRPIATADAVIAATVLAQANNLDQGTSLATRNLDDFADLGLLLINPWKGA